MSDDNKPRKVFLTDGYKAPKTRPSSTTETKGYTAPKGSSEGGKPPSSGSAVKPKSSS